MTRKRFLSYNSLLLIRTRIQEGHIINKVGDYILNLGLLIMTVSGVNPYGGFESYSKQSEASFYNLLIDNRE